MNGRPRSTCENPHLSSFISHSASSFMLLRHPRPSRPAGVRRRPRRGDRAGAGGGRRGDRCAWPSPPLRARPCCNWPRARTICSRPWASIPTPRPRPPPGDWERDRGPGRPSPRRGPGRDRAWTATGISRRFALQQEYFDRHLRLAQERDLPVIIHCRDAAGRPAADAPRGRRPRTAARRAARLQRRRGPGRRVPAPWACYVSFAGNVTYTNKKFEPLRAAAADGPRRPPLDRDRQPLPRAAAASRQAEAERAGHRGPHGRVSGRTARRAARAARRPDHGQRPAAVPACA